MSIVSLDQDYIRAVHKDIVEIGTLDMMPEPFDGVEPIKNVLIVGGNHESGLLGIYDREHLRDALCALMYSRIPIAPDFDCEIINISKLVDGRDFLDPDVTPKTDLLIIAAVPRVEDFGQAAFDMKIYFPGSSQIEVSPLDNAKSPNAWYDAAVRSEAKIAAAFNGGTSGAVENKHLAGEEFAQVPFRNYLVSRSYAKELGVFDKLSFGDAAHRHENQELVL